MASEQLTGMAPNKPTRSNTTTTTEQLTMDQKLDLLLSEVSDIKKDNKTFRDDIKELKDELQELKQDINQSIDGCFKDIKNCESAVNKNTEDIRASEMKIQNLSAEIAVVKKQLSDLQKSVRASEQYSRSNCLEIHGVPEAKHENIMDVVKRVARALSFDLKDNMVDAVHRLSKNPNNPQAPRGIILKFCRRLDMEQLRNKTRVKNGFSATDIGMQSENKIYVNLSLTRDTRVLWAATRAFKEQRNYKYAWITSAGKIFVRKTEGVMAVQITEKADLDSLK